MQAKYHNALRTILRTNLKSSSKDLVGYDLTSRLSSRTFIFLENTQTKHHPRVPSSKWIQITKMSSGFASKFHNLELVPMEPFSKKMIEKMNLSRN